MMFLLNDERKDMRALILLGTKNVHFTFNKVFINKQMALTGRP